MTYITYEPSGASITKELTWRTRLSWDLVVIADSESELVGSYEKYDQGVVTAYSSVLDAYRRDRTDDTTTGMFPVPTPWFIPRACTSAEGWTSLGRDNNGYDNFQRTFGAGVEQYHQIYKHDPHTGLVMEVVHVKGSERSTVAKVLTYTSLAATLESARQDPSEAPGAIWRRRQANGFGSVSYHPPPERIATGVCGPGALPTLNCRNLYSRC